MADWAVDQLNQKPKEPFFMSVGFFLPHVPLFATQKWFDLYPDNDTVLPKIKRGDRDDTPRFSWYMHWYLPEVRHKWLEENNQWRNIVRSYLACTSFTDSQVGRVLSALKRNGLRRTPLLSCGAITVGIWERKGSQAKTHCGMMARACRWCLPGRV